MAIQEAELYVYEVDGKVCAFIGLIEDYIAGLFVAKSVQSKGIGASLIAFVKDRKQQLFLSVYEENETAVAFYKKQGFAMISKKEDENTNHMEYEMGWKRENRCQKKGNSL